MLVISFPTRVDDGVNMPKAQYSIKALLTTAGGQGAARLGLEPQVTFWDFNASSGWRTKIKALTHPPSLLIMMGHGNSAGNQMTTMYDPMDADEFAALFNALNDLVDPVSQHKGNLELAVFLVCRAGKRNGINSRLADLHPVPTISYATELPFDDLHYCQRGNLFFPTLFEVYAQSRMGIGSQHLFAAHNLLAYHDKAQELNHLGRVFHQTCFEFSNWDKPLTAMTAAEWAEGAKKYVKKWHERLIGPILRCNEEGYVTNTPTRHKAERPFQPVLQNARGYADLRWYTLEKVKRFNTKHNEQLTRYLMTTDINGYFYDAFFQSLPVRQIGKDSNHSLNRYKLVVVDPL